MAVSLALRLARGPEILAPFERPPEALPLLGVALADHQEAAARRCGLRVVDHPGAGSPWPAGVRVVFERDAVFTPETLKALLREARQGPAQAAVAPGTALFAFTAPLCPGAGEGPLPLPLWAGELDAEARLDAARLAVVCDEADFVEVKVAPYGPAPHTLRIPSGRRLGGRLAHWMHLLNLNQAFLERERRARGLLRGANVRGHGVEVARTAFAEGSVLGDGVVLEPHASVLDSWIGAGVRVASHAVLSRCVIGEGCHTLIDTHLRRIVAFPGSTLSNIGVTDVILGEDIFITTGVAFFGGTPGRTVTLDGVDTLRPVLGGAVGPRCILGARSLFDAAACVPAGTVIVGRPDDATTGLTPERLEQAHMILGRFDENY